MNQDFDGASGLPGWALQIYLDYVAQERAWWEFLRGTGAISDAEALWVLWGQTHG